MIRLLPAPKHIEKTGEAFVPMRWECLQFPQEVERAASEIGQIMAEKWNSPIINQMRNEAIGEGFGFWLGEERQWQDWLSLNKSGKIQTPDRAGAYYMQVQANGVYAWSASVAGLYYAMQTLRQILLKEELVELKIIDWPDLDWRGVHLDAKGERPGFRKLLRTVSEWGRFKVNMVLFEYEDTFPYLRRPEITGLNAYTRGEIKELQHLARHHFMTIVPLVQTIGHAEYILKQPRYAFLREGGEISQLCSSQDEVFHLLEDLIQELAEAHPDSPWIHIGGDEAWHLGRCTDCADQAQKEGFGRLYIDHMNRVISMVKQTGKKAILWDDVLRRMDNWEDIKRLDRSCIVHYWDYQTCGNPIDTDWIRYLQAQGFEVMGGSAMRGASGMDSFCPKFQQRYRNSKEWGSTAERFSLSGVIATSWGRYGALKPLIEPFDLGWYGAVAAAEHFWNTKGMDRDEFDERFSQIFLGLSNSDFPRSMKKFEKALTYHTDWLSEKECERETPSGNFLTVLDAMWRWQTEEQKFSRKLELLEARLYRVNEAMFPEWERWRMVDRAQEWKEGLHDACGQLQDALSEIVDEPWLEEYIEAFSNKYFFRLENVLQRLIPERPRNLESRVKIGVDYG